MGNRRMLAAVAAAGAAILGVGAQNGRRSGADAGAYADPAACAACHGRISETYRLTGMGRSFHKPSLAGMVPGSYYHAPSDSYFSMARRGEEYFQRRHQLDAVGRETNVFEKRVDYVMGSGNHARTYLHRTPGNALIELPLGWYAESGGAWAMNPGYDRPDHEGFRRRIGYDCMFCHNGYPRIPTSAAQTFAEPVYPGALPEGIDCQRCHGPGLRHIQLAKAGAAGIRAAIVNPARLSPERREEICIQCHLESTSFPLPNSLARYDRGPFAYRPGEPLSNYWLFFDHAPGSGRGDKFEFVNAVYRIRQSKCFLASDGKLGCTACHNPHDVPRGGQAIRHYDSACRRCHAAEIDRAVAAGSHTAAPDCAACHMPKRRTEDVVHAFATDHLIARRPPAESLSPMAERHEAGESAYRGEVALYYPPKLPATADAELHLAAAQVVNKSNLEGGIPLLATAIARSPNARWEFQATLADAYRDSGQWQKAVKAYREAARRKPGFTPLMLRLASALRRTGQTTEAASLLRRAVAIDAGNAAAWHEIGLVEHSLGDKAAAAAAFEKAAALDPDLPEARNSLGIVRSETGAPGAEADFREAIRIQPAYADAHANLANLLAGAGDFEKARHHFEAALRIRPGDARTLYNFAMALGRARQYVEAQRQLEAALNADPEFGDARVLLAQMLLAKGDAVGAAANLRKAAAHPDPTVRQRAAELLRQVSP
ncbi:MAG: tetratricopeptide repeat protein [Bryobacteraceae bacterium]